MKKTGGDADAFLQKKSSSFVLLLLLNTDFYVMN
jgi:hypothetical protein